MKAFTTGWRKPRPVATVAMARQSKENFRLRGKKKLGQILNLEYSVNLQMTVAMAPRQGYANFRLD